MNENRELLKRAFSVCAFNVQKNEFLKNEKGFKLIWIIVDGGVILFKDCERESVKLFYPRHIKLIFRSTDVSSYTN